MAILDLAEQRRDPELLLKKLQKESTLQVKKLLGGLVFIVLASIVGVAIGIWVFKHFNVYIPLENQAVNIDLQEPLQAKVKIQDALISDRPGRVIGFEAGVNPGVRVTNGGILLLDLQPGINNHGAAP